MQDSWNEIKHKLVKNVDIVASIEEFSNECSIKSIKTPTFNKKLSNRRNTLLNKLKKGVDQKIKDEIKSIYATKKSTFERKNL